MTANTSPTSGVDSIHDDIVWRPGPEHLERSRLLKFMQRFGIKDLSELQKRSVENPTWFWEAVLQDIGKNFKPDLIFISAGFDAHLTDPLGQLRLDDDDFTSMTRTVMQWADDACNGRIVSCLEGGYNLDTLGQTVALHVAELNAEART